MTYCLGILVSGGLVFAADSRTNAGIDNVATFRKLNTYVREGDRAIVTCTAGNLSITQSVENHLRQWIATPRSPNSIMKAKSMFEVARIAGAAMREVYDHDGEYLKSHKLDFNSSLIIGGQVKDEAPRLFLVYAAGNFIEATTETPYVQIGEVKYGKPVLDRLIRPETDLMTAAKCALVSFDSTMRSNVSVGLPIDLVAYRTNSLRIRRQLHIVEGDAYYGSVRKAWSAGLARVFEAIPDPDWGI